MDPDSFDPDSPRPASLWLLLVLAAVLVALFFFPDLRELVSRYWRR